MASAYRNSVKGFGKANQQIQIQKLKEVITEVLLGDLSDIDTHEKLPLTPRAFYAPPIDLRVRTHPVRLNRARPQLSPPETGREALTKIQEVWKTAYQLATLTAAAFSTLR